ncbi:MAG: GNAT family N-acetyltransferase [Bacilli bacterium]|nr:GNAT family N-acetyltransferase [Bacilli bacterium]
MIIEITNEKDSYLDNKYLKEKDLKNELKYNPFGKILILVENNKIIGYLYYSDIYDRAEINQIEIQEIHRNCGKGDLLLKKMISLVDKDITLEVRIDNLSAIRLYEKNNFQKVAIRKNYYNGIDGLLMERKK